MKRERETKASSHRSPGRGSRSRVEARGPKPEAHQFASLRPGQKLTLSVRGLNLDGAGVATVGSQRVAVPFALPGKEPTGKILPAARRPTEKQVSLRRKT